MKTNWQQIFYNLALWLCVVTLPLTIKANSASIILLTVAWLSTGAFKDKYERLKQSRWIWFFILFYALHIVGLGYTSDLPDGLFELEKKLTLVLLPVVIASSMPVTRSFFMLLKRSFVASCTVVIVVSIIIAFRLGYDEVSIPQNFDLGTNSQFKIFNPTASPLWQYFSYLQIGEWIDIHPAYFSMYVIFSIIILLQELVEEKRMVPWKIMVIIFLSFFLSFLASRMAVITFLVVIGYYAWKCYAEKRTLVITVSSLFLILLFFLFLNPVSRFRLLQEPRATALHIDEQTIEWTSVSLRVLEWKGSMNSIKQYWVKGVGTGGVQNALINYYNRFKTETFNTTFNSHNQYLQTSIELGLTGLVTLIAIIAFTTRVAWQRKHTLYLSFIILFCLMCLTESMLERQKGIVFFTLFHSLFLSTDA